MDARVSGQARVPYGDLERHRATMAKFGQGMKPIEAVARTLA